MIGNRRMFLKSTLMASLLGIVVSSLLKPIRLLAAWPAERFAAQDIKSALGGVEGSASSELTLNAPDIAENGAVVEISVESSLPNVESISILVKENQRPLSAVFILSPSVQPNIKTRIKMAKTSEIIAVVKTGDRQLTTAKEVKVTVGGCGG